ncbi:hypothetical protein [Microbacterium sp. 22296]|uniref:hypothetical protein n=1 Tax=Microbacterium sp. 22296 TaxID=3453903 RepID=UPI003F8790A7
MTREFDVVVLGGALTDITTPSAGAAERPGGSPAAAAITVGRQSIDPPTREDPQLPAALKESA